MPPTSTNARSPTQTRPSHRDPAQVLHRCIAPPHRIPHKLHKSPTHTVRGRRPALPDRHLPAPETPPSFRPYIALRSGLPATSGQRSARPARGATLPARPGGARARPRAPSSSEALARNVRTRARARGTSPPPCPSLATAPGVVRPNGRPHASQRCAQHPTPESDLVHAIQWHTPYTPVGPGKTQGAAVGRRQCTAYGTYPTHALWLLQSAKPAPTPLRPARART